MSLFAYVNALRNISRVLQWGGGVEKRISQNRKLLKLLEQEAPALIGKHPEILGWLQASDRFLTELEAIVALEEGMLQTVTAGAGHTTGAGLGGTLRQAIQHAENATCNALQP